MERNNNFIGGKRAVDCENYQPTRSNAPSISAKERGRVKRAIEQLQADIEFKKMWG